MENNIEKIIPRYVCEEFAALTAADAKLTKRPWDRFRPDSTSWYLVPSSSVTYYKYGKLFFSKDNESDKSVKCGLFFEKGLGQSLAPVYSTKQAKPLFMDATWFWHKLITSGKIDELKKLGDFNLMIEGGYITEPNSFDPYRMRMIKWDKYIMKYETLKDLFSVESSARGSFVLKLHGIRTFNNFSSAIKGYENDDWLWLNLFIYRETGGHISGLKDKCKELYEHFIRGCLKLVLEQSLSLIMN